MARQLSQQGAAFIAAFEGIILEGYPDPGTNGPPWTIGIGHTAAAGAPAVRKGDVISLARAAEIYASDMTKVEADVNRAVKVEITQAAFDALVSFHFNTGALAKSTVDDRLNRGDREGALQTLGLYVNAAGHRMEGLARRRRAEIAMFKTGVYPNLPIMVQDKFRGGARNIAAGSFPWRKPALPPPVLDIDVPLPPIVVFHPNLPAVIVKKPALPESFWSLLWKTLRNKL